MQEIAMSFGVIALEEYLLESKSKFFLISFVA